MKNFKNFLTEITLSRGEAETILKLPSSYTSDDVKKAYKVAAIANHPDKGGSKEMMQKINLAYELLKSSSRTAKTTPTVNTNERVLQVLDAMVKNLNVAAYEKHFESIFKENFESKIETNREHVKNKGVWFWYITLTVHNKDRTKYFELSIMNSERPVASLGGGDAEQEISMRSFAYKNGKKIKMTQSVYNSVTVSKAMNSPESLFPKNKLEQDTAKKKITKADMRSFLTKEMQAQDMDNLGTMVFIPLDELNGILVTRSVMMRTPAYSIELYQRVKPGSLRLVPLQKTVQIFRAPEVPETIELIRRLKKLKDVNKIQKEIESVKDHFRQLWS